MSTRATGYFYSAVVPDLSSHMMLAATTRLLKGSSTGALQFTTYHPVLRVISATCRPSASVTVRLGPSSRCARGSPPTVTVQGERFVNWPMCASSVPSGEQSAYVPFLVGALLGHRRRAASRTASTDRPWLSRTCEIQALPRESDAGS